MTFVQISQIIGTVSIFLLFTIKLYIVASPSRFIRSGKAAMLWTIMYVYFLFILRLLSLTQMATPDQLRVISGWSSLIPLFSILFHLFVIKNSSSVLK